MCQFQIRWLRRSLRESDICIIKDIKKVKTPKKPSLGSGLGDIGFWRHKCHSGLL